MLITEFKIFESNINHNFFISEMKKIAKEKNILTDGDFIYLYHGTSKKNYNSILKSNKLNSGTWLSEDEKTCERYAKMSTNGKPYIMHLRIYMGCLYYNGYFSTLEDLYLYKNNEYVPKDYVYEKI